MVPLATTDAGTGVYAVAFNAPYQAVRQVVTLDNIISRVSFETIPQVSSFVRFDLFALPATGFL